MRISKIWNYVLKNLILKIQVIVFNTMLQSFGALNGYDESTIRSRSLLNALVDGRVEFG